MAQTTKRKRITEQTRKSAVSSDLAPLYAVAGLTEVVADRLRTVANESRQLVTDRITALRSYSGERVSEATGELGGKSLPELIRTMPEFTKQQLVKVGEYADAGRAKAGAAYAELAGRGKVGVEGALGDAAGQLDPVLERLQDGVTKLRESVAGKSTPTPAAPRTAKKSTTKKPSA
ncbi:hypothetical protein [Microlunatus speluncae]|uniref:hypothetical protein n=1 Tax=Microlunatus speluncae TaxID=2594267 RepID=UPI00126615F0|nr:hypothetical protein [Microlunatus speluncae]